jgi:hypothetical protein
MEEVRLWLAIIGAVAVKLVLSDKLTLARSFATSSAGIFAAWVFTDPLLNALGWEPDRYRIAVAALLALTGENILRRLLDFTNSESMIAEILKMWRGK